jgi:hypothetical protein
MGDFSQKIMEKKRKWNYILKVLEKRPKIQYPEKIFFRNEGERRHFQIMEVERIWYQNT